ncbi:MAG TPA: hypothetical protein VHK65_15705 [Candidatus Dormibacteraeota bacterium]|nr:hypothetical protein [Candidatus Dormibacteraeota bacterium]
MRVARPRVFVAVSTQLTRGSLATHLRMAWGHVRTPKVLITSGLGGRSSTP